MRSMIKRRARFVFNALTLMLSACSLLYVMLMAHTWSFYAGFMELRFVGTLVFYGIALWLGWRRKHYLSKVDDLWRRLLGGVIFLALLGGLAWSLVGTAQIVSWFIWASLSVKGSIAVFMTLYGLWVVSIGWLTGAAFHSIKSLQEKEVSSEKKNLNLRTMVLGGAFVAVGLWQWLLPVSELIVVGFVIMAVNLLLVMGIFIGVMSKQSGAWRFWVMMILMGGIVGGGMIFHQEWHQYYLKKFYYRYDTRVELSSLLTPLYEWPFIQRYATSQHVIDIVPPHIVQESFALPLAKAYHKKFYQQGNPFQGYKVFVDGVLQNMADYEAIHHEYLVHVPVQVNGQSPQKVLVIGDRDGLVLREVLKYPSVKSVTWVEPDQALTHLLQDNAVLKEMAQDSLNDPRVTVVHERASQFVAQDEGVYDAVYLDFFNNTFSDNKYFTQSFLRHVNARLSAEGFMAFFAPGMGHLVYRNNENAQWVMKGNPWPIYFNTLRAAGYKSIIPYVSNLEVKNELAYKGLRAIYDGLQNEGKLTPQSNDRRIKAEVEQYIYRFVTDVQYGFVMAKKTTFNDQITFINYPIELNVLNAQRLKQAFDVAFHSSGEINQTMVNTRWTPQFPRLYYFLGKKLHWSSWGKKK